MALAKGGDSRLEIEEEIEEVIEEIKELVRLKRSVAVERAWLETLVNIKQALATFKSNIEGIA